MTTQHKTTKRRLQLKDGKCPICGGTSFSAPYTERAWNDYEMINGKLILGESGNNIDEHIQELESAVCANYSCGQAVDLSDFEVE